MLNLRKLKQDFSPAILKEGKGLFDSEKVVSLKILQLDAEIVRLSGRVLGQFENTYECEIEINRAECEATDSNCDCPYNYDCQHIAALLFHLEENLDEILVAYSKEEDLSQKKDMDEKSKEELLEVVKVAETKEVQRRGEQYQKELLQEYIAASSSLATSPFFLPQEKIAIDRAEIALIFVGQGTSGVEVQLALRLPTRSKPLNIPNIKDFLEALKYQEPLFIAGKKYCFSLDSFEEAQKELVRIVMEQARILETGTSDRQMRVCLIDVEDFGMILAAVFEMAMEKRKARRFSMPDDELPVLPCIYEGSLEGPLKFSPQPAALRFFVDYLPPPTSKILLNPKLIIDQKPVTLEEVRLFECAKPGMIHDHVYFRFPKHINRLHLRNLIPLRDLTIPEPLFGTLIENALPELGRFAEVAGQELIEKVVTLPFVGTILARCDLTFVDGELEAMLHFNYDGHEIPAVNTQLLFDDVMSFVTEEGILARNLAQEKSVIDDLFQDFIFAPESHTFVAKSEKKIVEFMTEVIPRNQHRITFNCPQNLLDQFIYDQTTFELTLSHTSRIDLYSMEVKVNGALKGIPLDLLWDCMASKRAFIELDLAKGKGKKGQENYPKMSKILVLDLERIAKIVHVFDELQIVVLDDHVIERPLWSLASIEAKQFEELPIKFSITDKLLDIREQMLGGKPLDFSQVPQEIKATLRPYQLEGVHWLERLRNMYLGGILADDMGLGKTLQAIVAITQLGSKRRTCLVVCPTSLLYNWKEELTKFNPQLTALVIDGIPTQRKKLLEKHEEYDILITSYSLLQKDIDNYKEIVFSYMILDEAQNIKNRGTRNAKSVKLVAAEYKLILSGTPIENSLDELWSLFDFLMPGFLSSYERFIEKYIRISGSEQTKNLEYLRKKVSPFILRRMKGDVLDDLPPVSEIVYHCQLSEVQQALYRSYAASARDELVKLVERDGFDKVQIHVLATLTRLKQICCHPAIFAKETAEIGDSAKYDMFVDLVQNLIEAKHKTVIFSQYTRMFQIMREDFDQRGIRFSYLDGSSKNRLELVKEFNDDENISVFLVSLKAGGTGLNLVGADTVIHYDMWWNPAVENQATDRVHRIGQKRSVSSYKLITLGTIEEKIVEMQKRKKGLVKKVVSCDDEAITKLTWEDVLELLQG